MDFGKIMELFTQSMFNIQCFREINLRTASYTALWSTTLVPEFTC